MRRKRWLPLRTSERIPLIGRTRWLWGGTHEKVDNLEPDSSALLVDDEAQASLDARVPPARALLVEDAGDGRRQDLAVPAFRERILDGCLIVRLERGDGRHVEGKSRRLGTAGEEGERQGEAAERGGVARADGPYVMNPVRVSVHILQ